MVIEAALRPVILVVLFALPVCTQTPKPPPDALGRSTPRGTVVGFLRAAEAGNYALASEYLDLRGSAIRGVDLARELQAVLDRSRSIDVTGLSRTPEGDLRDDLPPTRERVNHIEIEATKLEIDLERVAPANAAPVWLFSADTLGKIPGVFDTLEASSPERWLPRFLREKRIFSVPLWKWLGTILGLAVTLQLASLLTRVLVPVLLQPILWRLVGRVDETETAPLRGPIRLLLVAAAIRAFVGFSPSLLSRERWTSVATALLIVGAAWLASRFVDLVAAMHAQQLLRLGQPGKITMLALFRRLFKILAALVAGLLLLQRAGVNIVTMLAGLGVGGIALALAAQKTLENLFGGITLIMRDAIRVGDMCTVGNQTGVVEDIGLGSTKLRTLDRTVVTLPNAQISQLSLENVSLRDKFWFHQVFGLRYDTEARQTREILEGIENVLHAEQRVDPVGMRVRFTGFGASSQTIEVFAYVHEQNYERFLEVQQGLLLEILDVIAGAGTCIATPVAVTSEPRSSIAGKV